jgi:long-chain acyl-CoA synthetase
MDYKAVRNLATMFFDQAATRGDKPFLWAKRQGQYEAISWRQARNRVSALSRGLRALGIEPGDRVALISENRPEWPIADLAIMSAGAITVPAYTTNTIEDHHYILDNSSAKAAIVSSAKLAQRVLPAAERSPSVEFVVALESSAEPAGNRVQLHSWAEVESKGETLPDDVRERAAERKREDTACLIYTSGTGGNPKGVMLSHGSIICNAMGAHDILLELGLDDEVFLSFLPLSHSYEHTGGLYFPISIGAQIYYAEGADTLVANLAEAKPTIVTAVPRLYEVMHGRILKGIEKASPFRRRLFERTLALGRKRYETPQAMTLGDKIVDAVLDRLVRRKVGERFGGRLKAFVSGGAPLNYEVGLFFTALGVRILQGYGQTEAAPVISCNRPSMVKLRTVGPPLTDVDVRIAEDGEILVKGELVMQGYWGEPEATRSALREGWLHTGDVGVMDADGCIQITDRKRDIIVNSGGDNVSPARVEGFLTLQPEIGQAMVFGDRRPHLVALLVPDPDWLAGWAREAGKPNDLAQLADDADLRSALSEVTKRVNATLSPLERVRNFIVASEPFTTDNGMMTPSLKIRRHKIKATYGQALEGLYA